MRKHITTTLLLILLSAASCLYAASAPKAKADGINRTYYYTAMLYGNIKVDSIAVHKAERELQAFSNGQLVKIYRVCLGQNPVGPKQVNGDKKTPEGLYRISYRNAGSLYHKSLAISYPNKQDVERAKKMGESAGGDVMIHGLPNFDAEAGPDKYTNDWTWGCIALRNHEIDELFERVKPGTPILIMP
ncbi:MAG TPA: L,D-transpeptidase family protein [Chitinophagales bacterium]|nr:L,D-transpeptidase family protein [Chitinophagales bacterium]